MKHLFISLISFLFLVILSCLLQLSFLKPIFVADHIIFPYAIHPFDICILYPKIWFYIKVLYVFLLLFIYSNIWLKIIRLRFKHYKKAITKRSPNITIHTKHQHNKPQKHFPKDSLRILIGFNEKNTPIYVSGNGLYQNILITGTIGTGKTSSAMYPFTMQLMNYKHKSDKEKIGMLVLDVKGNYAKQIYEYANLTHRIEDLVIIDLSGKIKYNPLDKPNLNANVLAHRLRTILSLFSKNQSESYWLDKAEQALCEAIKLCRLYNNGYVTFTELHKLIFIEDYYKSKISELRKQFLTSTFNNEDSFDLIGIIDFFQNEFFSLDSRTLNILKSEISLITGIFVSDFHISNVFCPNKEEINFKGFRDVISKGKIVVLKMNISEYKNLSKLIAAYLKLDFQNEILSQLSNSDSKRQTAFICDEYHEYVTDTDSNFLSICREAKCINILATQSYTSILSSLNNEYTTKVILQNIINKLWFRTDDIFTIEHAQKQIGKVDHIKHSINISENAKQTNYNAIFNKLISHDSTISESYNQYTQFDYKYDTNYFSQSLKTFEALAFLSDGNSIQPPQKIKLIPYFSTNPVLDSLYKED